MDPYAVLGVDPDASPDQIREAFRALVRDRHPDTAPPASAPASVAEVIEAYRILRDPETRARYDAGRRRLASPSPQRCPECDGRGQSFRLDICPSCGGVGQTTLLGSGRVQRLTCRPCSGRGRLSVTVACQRCSGTGRV
ncbi:MAG TPA: DnaJ domain-containing protein [Acidimicrobiia bacterium]|nr:DnaJ domain-containing protein [Acidimicrobiia bacterium]